MTVETNDTVERYTISGTGPYAYNFRIFDEDELAVTAISTAGVPVALTIASHYTVSGVDDEDGGSVTLISASATNYAGYTLDIRSNTTQYQPTSIRNQGAFLPEIHEDAFDRASRQIQDVSRRNRAAIRFPDNEILDGELPGVDDRKGKYAYFNATTGAIDPALAIEVTALSQSIFNDYQADSDPYKRTDAEIAVGVTPTNYAFEPDYARRFGAPVTGLTSANAAIANADLAAIQGGSLVIFSPGTYLIDDGLTITSGAYMLPGAKISIASGKTLTFAAHAKIVAGETMQIFSGAGNVLFPTDTVANVYAAWFGFGHAFTGAQNKAALINAMNALTSGGTIVLPKTGCYLDGDIVPPFACLLIQGQGWESGYNNTTQTGTTLIANSGTNLFDLSAHFLTPNPNEYFAIEGCKLDGNGAIANGLKIMGTKTVRGCLVRGFTTAGIWLADYINQTLIEKTTCVDNGPAGAGVGLLAEGTQSTKFQVKECNFRLNFRGMEIRSGANYTLQDCVFESNTERGLLERNADGSNLIGGLHINLWFENNNSLAGTRTQLTMSTTATSTFYPRSNRWIGGNINGGSAAGQRCMDIGANCLDTVFSGTRFANVSGDTSSISVAAGTNTLFDDCINTTVGETIDSASATSVGNYRQRNCGGGLVLGRTAPVYGATTNINCAIANEFDVTVTDGNAFAVAAPLTPHDGMRITITVRNASGGALGAITWNAVFKMAAWTSPANANSRSIDFKYNGTNWVEVSRTTADVPN